MISPTEILDTGYNLAQSVDLSYLAQNVVDNARNVDLSAILNSVGNTNSTGAEETGETIGDTCSSICCCSAGAVVVTLGAYALYYVVHILSSAYNGEVAYNREVHKSKKKENRRKYDEDDEDD
jgi:hypothetical protein